MHETTRRDVLLGIGASAALTACGGKQAAAQERLGVLVVGVGSVAVDQVIPAINRSSACRLAGLVDIDPERLREVGRRFGLSGSVLRTPVEFDRIADDREIDLVYIAVPNALHANYAIRSARAGKHVLVEKPMATSEEECAAMVDACRSSRTKLAVAYRLNYSPHHRMIRDRVRHPGFGPLKLVRADIGYPLGADGGWRLKRALSGGGALLEQGVYCVNAACQLTGEEPVEVLGDEIRSDARRFAEVDETVIWSMRFASGAVAQCLASYSVPTRQLWAGSTSGWLALDEPFSYDEIKARSPEGDIQLEQVDQFALQMDHFCGLIRSGAEPGPGICAADGMRDVRIISAIYESIRTGQPVSLTPS